MKKFFYLFALLFGLTVMTSCEKEPETDQERFVGTWVHQDPSATGNEAKEMCFTFNADGKGNVVKIGVSNQRESFRILEWKLFEDRGDKFLEFMDEYGDSYEYEYEFDGDVLLLGVEGDSAKLIFNRK